MPGGKKPSLRDVVELVRGHGVILACGNAGAPRSRRAL